MENIDRAHYFEVKCKKQRSKGRACLAFLYAFFFFYGKKNKKSLYTKAGVLYHL